MIFRCNTSPSCHMCVTVKYHMCVTVKCHMCVTVKCHMCVTVKCHMCVTVKCHMCVNVKCHMCVTGKCHMCVTMKRHKCVTIVHQVTAVEQSAASFKIHVSVPQKHHTMRSGINLFSECYLIEKLKFTFAH